MIFVTGDTHGSLDIHKLNTTSFYQKELSKQDYVVILGDFGLLWNNSGEDKYWLDWLNKKNFTTLFVDGNHENFDLLNSFEIDTWCGGKVHKIRDSIIHLMRGQVFSIDGYKIFTMGGAASIDKAYRKVGLTWWKDEIPSQDEMSEGLENLALSNWKVDFVFTHTTSNRIMETMKYVKEKNVLNDYFDMLQVHVHYNHWYCGHLHCNETVMEKHTVLYEKIIRIGEDERAFIRCNNSGHKHSYANFSFEKDEV